MSIYNSKLWISDLDEVISDFPFLSELEGKAILITGAAGLVCSAVTDVLIRYNETHENTIKILAAGRWPEKMKNRFGTFFDKNYFVFCTF